MHSVVMSATGSTATETGMRRKEDGIVPLVCDGLGLDEAGACVGGAIARVSATWTSSLLMLYSVRYEAYSEPG